MNTPPQLSRPALQLRSRPHGLFIALVVLGSSLAFTESLRFGFVFDDTGQIVDNQHISSFKALPEYFTRATTANFYRPFFMVWLLFNRTLFGLNQFGWHFSSIMLHAGASLLVFLIARRLLRADGDAFVAALLFALHPTKVEAVTWVSGVTEPLMAVFVLGSFYAYLRSRDDGPWWRALGLFAAIGAMLSKETGVVVAPLVFAFALIFSGRKGFGDALKAVWPFAVLAAAYIFGRSLVIDGFAHSQAFISGREMVLTWPKVGLFYLLHFLWPADLAVYYEVPTVHRALAREFLLPAAVLAATLAMIVVVFRKTQDRVWLFGWVWGGIALMPVLYLRGFNPNDFVHDRYLYLPSVGCAIAVAAAFSGWRKQSILAVPAASVLMLLLLLATLAQQPYWKNNLLLFSRAYQISPGSEYVLNNLGIEMEKRGEYDRAVSLYRTAVAKSPRLWTAQFNLGLFLFRTGALADADEHLTACLRTNPTYVPAMANLALVRVHRGDVNSGLELAQRAVDLAPGNADYLSNLGVVRQAAGDMSGARAAFTAALRIDPQNVDAKQALQMLPLK